MLRDLVGRILGVGASGVVPVIVTVQPGGACGLTLDGVDHAGGVRILSGTARDLVAALLPGDEVSVGLPGLKFRSDDGMMVTVTCGAAGGLLVGLTMSMDDETYWAVVSCLVARHWRSRRIQVVKARPRPAFGGDPGYP